MKLKPINKKGQLGMDAAKGFLLGLLVVVILGVVAVVIADALLGADTSAAGSTQANITNNVVLNATTGIQTFFSNAGTWFSLLSVVVIILIVAVVIFAVNRFGQGGGSL